MHTLGEFFLNNNTFELYMQKNYSLTQYGAIGRMYFFRIERVRQRSLLNTNTVFFLFLPLVCILAFSNVYLLVKRCHGSHWEKFPFCICEPAVPSSFSECIQMKFCNLQSVKTFFFYSCPGVLGAEDS